MFKKKRKSEGNPYSLSDSKGLKSLTEAYKQKTNEPRRQSKQDKV